MPRTLISIDNACKTYDTPEGGKVIQTPKADEAQTVEVRGTRRMLASKSKKATWC